MRIFGAGDLANAGRPISPKIGRLRSSPADFNALAKYLIDDRIGIWRLPTCQRTNARGFQRRITDCFFGQNAIFARASLGHTLTFNIET